MSIGNYAVGFGAGAAIGIAQNLLPFAVDGSHPKTITTVMYGGTPLLEAAGVGALAAKGHDATLGSAALGLGFGSLAVLGARQVL